MKNALILHGIEGYAGIHWQKWLCDELVKKEYKVVMPDLPNPNRPDRKKWLRVAKSLTRDVDFSEFVIIGHSLGVVTALDLIESVGKKIKALISVSGFVKDYGVELNSYFLRERTIDLNKIRNLVEQTFVIYSDNDPYVPQEILKHLADGLDAKPVIIKNGGHINTDSGYTKSPIVLEILEGK
ncbi:alpha/beta hydrolase [Patescibacteria group bacterium]|nr:alpha/beta hydrolase [Patescibacteria group bacterium]